MRGTMSVKTASLGSIVKTVGLKGEIKLLPGPDFWAAALNVRRLYLVTPEGMRREVHIDRSRIKGRTYIIKLSGIDSIDEAQLLVRSDLQVSMADIEESELPERIRPFQVIGFLVKTRSGGVIGAVVDMLLGPEQDCLIVESGGERMIVPNVPELIVSIDNDEGVIEIDPPEGLLDLRW